jgi:hypothetical protein
VGYASRYFQGHVKVGIVDVPVVVSMVGTHIKMIAGIEKNYPAYPGSDLHEDGVLASDGISMQVTKEVFAKSQYIGELGKVGKWFFKLYEILDKDNYTIWVVIDRSGNRGFWYNSPVALNGAQVPEVGDCFTVTAKVVVQKIDKGLGVKETRFVSVNIVAPNKSLTNVSSTSTDEQMITTTKRRLTRFEMASRLT